MWEYLTNAGTLDIIAWSVFIGASLSSLLMYFNKTVLGSLVRALLSAGADSPEHALNLAELKQAHNIFVILALRGNGVLRKLVNESGDKIIALENGGSYAEKSSVVRSSVARYYIREENRVKAELRYSKKGSDIFLLFISIAVFFALALFILFVVPSVLDFTSWVLNWK